MVRHRKKPVKSPQSDHTKLITYLGARTSHRFEGGRPLPRVMWQHRAFLALLLLVFLGLAVCGIWQELAP